MLDACRARATLTASLAVEGELKRLNTSTDADAERIFCAAYQIGIAASVASPDLRAYERMDWYNYLAGNRGHVGRLADELLEIEIEARPTKDETAAQAAVREANREARMYKKLALCVSLLHADTLSMLIASCHDAYAPLLERIRTVRMCAAIASAQAVAATFVDASTCTATVNGRIARPAIE